MVKAHRTFLSLVELAHSFCVGNSGNLTWNAVIVAGVRVSFELLSCASHELPENFKEHAYYLGPIVYAGMLLDYIFTIN